MELGKIRITFPVLRFTSKVYHFTPRRPTVFERVLLKLHERFALNEAYNNVSLTHIFEQILGVPDADVLIRPVLNSLIDLEVFRCSKHCHLLEEMALHDLERTPKGDEMLQSDMLPAVGTEHIVRHTYDPIHSSILDDNQQRLLRSDRMPFSISEGPFLDTYPFDVIIDSISAEKPPWWTPTTQIDRVQRLKTPRVLWMEQEISVHLEDDDNLCIKCEDQECSEYLNGLPDEALFADYIQPFLAGGKETPPWEPTLRTIDYAALNSLVKDYFPAPRLPDQIEWSGRIHCMRRLPQLLAVPNEISSGMAIIVFEADSAESAFEIHWNDNADGLCIKVAEPLPVPEVFYWDGESCCLGAAKLKLRLNGTFHEVPIAFAYAQEHVPAVLQEALARIGQELETSGRSDDYLALAFWQPVPQVWDRFFEHVATSGIDFVEASEQLMDFQNRLKRLPKWQEISTWDKDICKLFAISVGRFALPVLTEDLTGPIHALARCKVQDERELKSVFELIAGMIQPPSSLEALEAIYELFEPLGLTRKIPFPSSLYTPKVLIDYFNRFVEDGFESRMKGHSSLEHNLRALKIEEIRLKRVIGRKDILNFDTSTVYRSTLRSVNLHGTRECCVKWLRNWEAFLKSAPELTELLPNTKLERIHVNISGYSQFLGKFITQVPEDIRAVYIVDTNALIDQPNILSRFRTYELVVISKKVIDELDDKKSDERLREQVSEVTRALQNYKGNNLRYEEADPSLLPQGFKLKGDNLILSVALKYKPCAPILLTSDRNLSVKAKMEGLRAQTLPDFNKKRLRSPSIPIKEIEKQNNHTKRKNKDKERKRR